MEIIIQALPEIRDQEGVKWEGAGTSPTWPVIVYNRPNEWRWRPPPWITLCDPLLYYNIPGEDKLEVSLPNQYANNPMLCYWAQGGQGNKLDWTGRQTIPRRTHCSPSDQLFSALLGICLSRPVTNMCKGHWRSFRYCNQAMPNTK